MPPPLVFLGLLVALLALLVLFIVAVVKSFIQKTRGWIITAVLCLVLGMVCLGVLGGQVASGIGKMSAKAKLIEKTLVSKDGRYSIKVPNGWSEMPKLNAEADVGAGNLIMEQYFLMLVEQRADLELSLDEFSNVSAQQTVDRLEDGKMEDAQSIQIGNFKAVQRRITGSVDKVKIVFLHTSVETEQALLQLLYWTLPSKEKAAFPVFQQTVQTFAVKDEEGPATNPTVPSVPPR